MNHHNIILLEMFLAGEFQMGAGKTKNQSDRKISFRLPNLQSMALFIVIAVMVAALMIFVDNFASIGNITNLLIQVAPIAIMACAV